ncbi:hypothetical protein ACFWA5_47930 [Streptomyces mirabilis]|uniref:SpnB-like Rossmann fold domain-containing protein n=1 Tax=Streptomyces mirabilis TaxID=68239 RepID=UPI003656529B
MTADEVRLSATDPFGEPVLSIERLLVRPVEPDQLLHGSDAVQDSLYRVAWHPIDVSPPATEPKIVMLDDLTLDAPLVDGADAVVVECPPVDGPVVDAAERITADLLAFLRGWLADERLAGTRLVITTRNAVAAVDGDPATGLAHAPVWGMMRSAQAEHPDRGLTLLDLDDRTPGAHVVGQALGSDQPQLAARDGR